MFVYRAVCLIGMLFVSACSLNKGGAVISDDAWLLGPPQKEVAANGTIVPDYLPATCPQTEADAKSFDKAKIPDCVHAMLQLVDVKWVHFQDQLLSSSSNANFAADVGLLGLNTAGSLITGGATQILHAASAGITGLRTSVNQDLLYSQTITSILLQMEADRAAMKKQILDKLASKAGYGGIYEAANDVFFYARAGSWTHALLSMQKSAATSKGNLPGGSTPSSTPQPQAPAKAKPAPAAAGAGAGVLPAGAGVIPAGAGAPPAGTAAPTPLAAPLPH